MPFKVALLPLQLTPQPSDAARLLAASHLVTRTGRLYVSLDGDWSSASLDEAEARIQKIYALATKWRQSASNRHAKDSDGQRSFMHSKAQSSPS